jgi:electron-transferring-flavoprotein dehydrogenase
LRFGDALLRFAGPLVGLKDHAFTLPWTPGFLNKHGGLVLGIGQFNQWVGAQLMASGLVQIWPGSPVAGPLFSEESGKNSKKVAGLRLADQGVDKAGAPTDGFMAGMDVKAQLTVVGDGPVGAVGQALDEQFGLPQGHARREWALGMKFVIELPEDPSNPENPSNLEALNTEALAKDKVIAKGEKPSPLQPGTVWHSFGYPEPEIFGFLYVHPDRLVSVGIFVPSWLHDPSRTAYRYLQHYIQHPALWPYLKDGTLRSWGAKSLEESGRHGEPFLSGDGFARIGEGSGSTNVLTGSGVDEAWATGTELGEAVIELLRAGKPFTQENLAKTYEKRRRASWVERGAKRGRKRPQRLPEWHRQGHDRHGPGRADQGKAFALSEDSPAAQADCSFRSRNRPGTSKRTGPDRRRGRTSLARRPAHRARLAGDRVGRPLAGHAAGCAPDGRQGPGHGRLRRSRPLP